MRGIVKKWGNSAAVRIPASVMQAADIALEAPITVREENGRIIIEPDRREDIDLDDLVSRMSDENAHGEVDFGDAVGKEAF